MISTYFPIFTLVLSTFMRFDYMRLMFDTRYNKKWYYVVAPACISIINYVVIQFKNPLLNMLFIGVMLITVSRYMFCATWKQSTSYNILFEIICMLVDISATSICALFLKTTTNIMRENPVFMVFSNIIYLMLFFLAYRIYATICRKTNYKMLQWKEHLFLIMITAFEIFVMVIITNLIKDRPMSFEFLIILIGFIALNFYTSFFLEQQAKNNKLKQELELSKQLSDLQFRHYSELSQKYEDSRKIIHDIRRHIETERALYISNRNDDAAAYTKQLEETINLLNYGFACKNPILSVIIGSKLHEAENDGIIFSPEIQNTPIEFIDRMDITTIFANLLDNAIEYCKTLPDELKKINLRVHQYNKFIIISLSNPIDEEPQRDEHGFISSKEGHFGIGLQSVKAVVEKYDGSFSADVENDLFIVKITIPIHEA